MFSEQIENVFGDFINDGRIQCTKDEFKKNLESLLKIVKGKSVKKCSNRKASNFMIWLDTNRRSEIKDEFFSDFEEYDDWSINGIRKYYEQKGLPLDKLNQLIKKKEDEGKEVKKPRLMSLITIKAGLIWSEMSDEEKQEFKQAQTQEVETDNTKTSTSSTKKGRPAGYKAKQYASEQAIMDSIKTAQEANDSGEDNQDAVELEMFTHEGKELFKDDDSNVYNDDCELIGKITEDGNVVFN